MSVRRERVRLALDDRAMADLRDHLRRTKAVLDRAFADSALCAATWEPHDWSDF